MNKKLRNIGFWLDKILKIGIFKAEKRTRPPNAVRVVGQNILNNLQNGKK